MAPLTLAIRNRSTRWLKMIRLLHHAGRGPALGALVLNVTLGLLPSAFIVSTSMLLSRVPDVAADAGGLSWDSLVVVFAVALGAFALQQLLTPFQSAVTEVIARRVDEVCVERLLHASLRDAPIALLEDPEALDLLADARAAFERQAYTPGDAVGAIPSLVSRYCQLTAAVVLVGVVLSPLAGLILMITALVIRVGVRGTLGRFAAVWESLAGHRRRAGYIGGLATGATVAKEIRVYGLLPWLRERLRSDTMAHLRPMWAGSRRLQFWPFIGFSAVGFVGGAVAITMLAVAAGRGQIGLFALAVALQGVLIPMRFGVYFPECDVQTQLGMHSFHALERFEQRAATGRPVQARETTAPARPSREIRFDNVSFRYAADGPLILDGLDLTLPVGRSTAIVGLNGAGKTTLVKLLARLYEPTSGRITVDGTDLTRFDPDLWRRQLAVIFQDYLRYELTVAENIGLGAPALLTDDAAITAAAEQAGALDALRGMPDPLRTPLSSHYPGGTDLSGGQWQRIALARALLAVRGGASVLVLDEPTAQLDVRAEVEFHDRILATAKGITSVLISHRFSTVRQADQIVVIEHGRVVERGSHDELIRHDGRYAELFELQARRFRMDPVDPMAAR
ncbi:ABC transporter ATP-binding protein [Micromonospora sp. RTGN7]|uniref:ABC transporter ATP-binding protein n=1 Tax=Micromonospora sp. RTGN7 TaxID=3016526 RepID=UPI0029FEFFFC|nr:ABC transporter ATP-binding protein [Micromonospora sp. RTGN7]